MAQVKMPIPKELRKDIFEEILKHPYLYKRRHYNYNNERLTNRTWIVIANKFNVESVGSLRQLFSRETLMAQRSKSPERLDATRREYWPALQKIVMTCDEDAKKANEDDIDLLEHYYPDAQVRPTNATTQRTEQTLHTSTDEQPNPLHTDILPVVTNRLQIEQLIENLQTNNDKTKIRTIVNKALLPDKHDNDRPTKKIKIEYRWDK